MRITKLLGTLIVLCMVTPSITLGQERNVPQQQSGIEQPSPKRPPIRNYQDYLLMMKALNDVNREKGLPPTKPLTKKEWDRLWPEGGPDAPHKQNSMVPKKSNENDLLDAAFKGEIEKVNLLLHQGVNPDARASDGGTPLMYVALKGNTDVVKALIEKGAKVNARNSDRCTALMEAASNGYVDVIKILLKAGANPNAIAKDGTTALKWAKIKGYDDVAVILKNAGAKNRH